MRNLFLFFSKDKIRLTVDEEACLEKIVSRFNKDFERAASNVKINHF